MPLHDTVDTHRARNPRGRLGRSLALFATLGLGGLACDRGAPITSDPATALARVDVPHGFDFATTRAVRLHVAQPAGRHLEVRSEAGAILYRGPALAELPLSVPSQDQHLEVRQRGADRPVEVSNFAIVDGQVQL